MAWRHSVVEKVSVHELSAQHNISWVLSRLKIWIDRLPNYDETIRVKTYIQGVDKYFYYRDFTVTDANGIEIVKANSVWGLMDIVKRRITSIPQWMFDAHDAVVDARSGALRRGRRDGERDPGRKPRQ